MKREKRIKYGLYHKFAAIIILVGLLPMIGLTTFIANRMISDYYGAMENQYEQAANYIAKSVENMFGSYNSVSTMPYYYNSDALGDRMYVSYDNFRKMLLGECYSSGNWKQDRDTDMRTFLQNIGSMDPEINAVHFVANLEEGIVGFHNSKYSTYFRSDEIFLEDIVYDSLDTQCNQMILIPTHSMKYYGEISDQVFTIGRNYFDLRGEIGERAYVGTIYLDINVHKFEKMVNLASFEKGEKVYITDQSGNCFYSNEEECISENISSKLNSMNESEDLLVISFDVEHYGVKVTVEIETKSAFGTIRELQRLMYFVLGGSIFLVLFASIYFSKKLTEPIHKMMKQMKQIENGNFTIELEINSKDEIGLLSERFNQMSDTLNTYINQSYIAKMKQTEAELSSLKSQIYPHFLYNTLEVIRMSALDQGNEKVPEMIESLSEQIHYLIGPVNDMVSLEKEIDITRKYIYLLNCRIDNEIIFTVKVSDSERIFVPRLLIQPIVENAYIHGIKMKNENGCISIETEQKDGLLEVVVMDNGVGMDKDTLGELRKFLGGSESGRKEKGEWQSIGLKNVHDRIRYLYGEEYGIEITSTLGVGTMVRILMPFSDGGGS